MLKTTNSVHKSPTSAALVAFKPRQVVLAEHSRTKTFTMTKKAKIQSLNHEQKARLLHSVILYLEKNGFSKSLKRLLSEAQIQNEDWKASSLDLEDMYCKYLDTCNLAETNVNTSKKKELQTVSDIKEDGNTGSAPCDELIKKKKKKRSEESDKNVAVDQYEGRDRKMADSSKNSEEQLENNMLSEPEAKLKGKKKSKKGADYPDNGDLVQPLAMKEQVESNVDDEMDKSTKKNKDKKKMKNKSHSEDQEKIEATQVVVEEQSKDSKSAVCDILKENKSSKKRKVLASDENERQSEEDASIKESKRRKTEGFEESKKKDKSTVNKGRNESEHEHSQAGNIESHNSHKKQHKEHASEHDKTNKVLLEHANGNVEKSVDESSDKKSTRKQCNGSAEPKTVNAFQRVKINEVEFADEKLQDNSYWAKDGAEIGYGAKAQEVLGQVRGRDFRHEKTKKKRGSYRGGQIDLQSHSVKFNYSDED